MKKRVGSLTVLLFVMIIGLTSCSASDGILKGDIKGGVWDGNVFTNDWACIKFTLPDTYKSLSSDEIKTVVNAGEEVAVSDGKNQAVFDIAKMKTLYDFMIYADDSISSVSACYENTKLNTEAKNMDAEGYYNILKEQLESVTQLGYTFLEPGKETIAGEEYFSGKCSLYEGALFQEYYIRKQDDAFIVIITTYTPEKKDEILNFISSFENVKV